MKASTWISEASDTQACAFSVSEAGAAFSVTHYANTSTDQLGRNKRMHTPKYQDGQLRSLLSSSLSCYD